jgi:hypothetical protein
MAEQHACVLAARPWSARTESTCEILAALVQRRVGSVTTNGAKRTDTLQNRHPELGKTSRVR